MTDEQGAVLPGVTVTLSGDLGTRTAVTSAASGEFRFLALDTGRYKLTLALAGFGNVVRDVVSPPARTSNLPVHDEGRRRSRRRSRSPGETPLVDVKKRGTVDHDRSPTSCRRSRTPATRGASCKNVPGVMLDRVNIAGNENGQQADAAAKGSIEADKMWNLDGLVDHRHDRHRRLPVLLRLRRLPGDRRHHRRRRPHRADRRLRHQPRDQARHQQVPRRRPLLHGARRPAVRATCPTSSGRDPRLENPDGTFRDKADHIHRSRTTGFDLGGPILKDKLWFYGTWGKQDIGSSASTAPTTRPSSPPTTRS